MKRLGHSVFAAVAAIALYASPARAELPQQVMDQLTALSPERMTEAQRTEAADRAMAQWRSASPEAAPGYAEFAARAAHRAGRSSDAREAAQAVVNATDIDASLLANARLVLALETFAADAGAEAELRQALDGAAQANALLRSRAARALAIAHMRRDEQAESIARWRQAEAAAAEISGEHTYDLEVAMIGRAAAHAYANQPREGAQAANDVLTRMAPEIARLNAGRVMSQGERVYATALAWRTAYNIDHRVRRLDLPGYTQVGTAAPDDQGLHLCRGDFRLRPEPRMPYTAALADWQGATIIRLATDGEGRVIHAEAIAAVPPIRAFSHAALQTAPEWTYRMARDIQPNETPCRLQSEGQLIAWYFRE